MSHVPNPNINDELLWTLLNNCKHSAETLAVHVASLRRNGSPLAERSLKQAEESIKLGAGYIDHAQGDLELGGDREQG